MKKKLIAIVVLLPLLTAIAAVVLFLALPYIVDRYVLPPLVEELPFADKTVSISRISPYELRGKLRFGSAAERSVHAAGFTIRYSPTDLYHGKIDSLILDSVTIHLQERAGGVVLKGMNTGMKKRGSDTSEERDLSLPVLPVLVGEVVLDNGSVVLHRRGGEIHHFQVSGNILPSYIPSADRGGRLESLQARFSGSGALDWQAEIATNSTEKGQQLNLSLQLDNVAETVRRMIGETGLVRANRLRLEGRLETKGFQEVAEYSADLRVENLKIVTGGVVVEAGRAGGAAVIKLKGDETGVDYLLDGVRLAAPEPCAVSGRGRYDWSTASLHGDATLVPARTKTTVTADYKGTIGQTTEISYSLSGKGFTLEDALDIGNYAAKGSLRLTGEMISGKVEGEVAEVIDRKRDAAFRGLRFAMPFSLAKSGSVAQVPPGELIVEEARYRGERVASLKTTVALKDDKVLLDTLVSTPLVGEFQLRCSTEVNRAGKMETGCRLPRVSVAQENLPAFVKLPEELGFNGTVSAEFRYGFENGIHGGTATIKVEEAAVSLGEYSFTGIDGTLDFPDLPSLRSSPTQRLTIGKVDLGKIVLTDGKLFFRVDDAQTLFLERARLNWCGGRVETGGVTLKATMQELETTLYCDRIGYTALLSQLGVGEASGEGALNGRLPVKISGDGLVFDDGFLFSTPGDGGIVRFGNTQQLRQGMAAMKKTVYLDYSMDALENFSYNWTKLTFNTVGDELLLSLQLDGKPASPLPYGYQKGQMVPSSKGQGIQHPIRLDVNFRLPLRDLFHYGKNIQSFMENM